MEILQLKYFQHVARSENISHTAKEFFVPASSVSVAIKKLEKELGVKLFTRTSNSLKLSESGRIFLKSLDACERELKRAKQEMSEASSVVWDEIKILILTNRSLVNEAIMKFKKKYPEVSFSIVHENCGGNSSYSDFDIIVSDRIINSEQFEKRLIVSEELCVAVGLDNPLSSQSSVSLKRLSEEKFICMPAGTSLRENFEKLFSSYERFPKIAVECNDTFYICEYMKKGMGVTLFPKTSWSAKIDSTFSLLSIEEGMLRNSYLYINKDSAGVCNMFALALDNNI